MLTEEKIMEVLKEKLKPKRLKHSIGVKETAAELARVFGADVEKASLAGLIHDYAREIRLDVAIEESRKHDLTVDSVCYLEPVLLHGPLGAKLANLEFGVADQDILNAVFYHTTGRKDMSLLEKIIYVSDFIEPNRDFPGVEEARKIAFVSLDRCVLFAHDSSIRHIIAKGKIIHPDTVLSRNDLLSRLGRGDVR